MYTWLFVHFIAPLQDTYAEGSQSNSGGKNSFKMLAEFTDFKYIFMYSRPDNTNRSIIFDCNSEFSLIYCHQTVEKNCLQPLGKQKDKKLVSNIS